MIIEKENSNRCGIFLYYDADGKVDEYVIFLLESIRPFLNNLLIVCNGFVTESTRQQFERVSDEVLVRENEGFDVGGYREGIFHIGLDKLAEYEETLLFNYTFFGPLYPFSEMFDKMNAMDLDFWGITRHYKVEPDPYHVNRYGYLPEHIQSHFMALRRDFIKSDAYREFITNLKNPQSYVESICEYETIFTKYFEDLGYKWDTYVDTSEYEGYAYCPVMFYLKDMIEKQRCPILKRRSFFTDYHDFLLNTCGEPSIEAYEYIKDNLDYDLKLIWDNLLRVENISEIVRAMHLNYMLPANEVIEEEFSGRAAVFVFFENDKIVRKMPVLFEMPEQVDIILIGSKEVTEKVLATNAANFKEICLLDKNEYIAAVCEMIKHIDSYEFAAMFDVFDVEVEKPFSNYVSWQYRDIKNLFGTSCIVNNVLHTFKENERLGLLAPPLPNHGILFEKRANSREDLFLSVSEYLKEVGVKVNLKEKEFSPAPFGGSFWIRSSAVPNLKIIRKASNKEILVAALPYLVQNCLYYTGICYNNDYAAIEVTNQDYMLRELNKAVFEKYGPNYHKVVVDNINQNRIVSNPVVYTKKQRLKRKIVTILKKVLPTGMYGKLHNYYMRLRGWS